MRIVVVDASNQSIYDNLMQSYEGEFSVITRKSPGPDGKFSLDTALGGDTLGYLLYVNELPAGLAALKCDGTDSFEICEFYVVPAWRRCAIGTQFAHALWVKHPGAWTIKQIAGAANAIQFWRSAIQRFVGGACVEDGFSDPYWGEVTRQRFCVEPGQVAVTS